MSNGPTEPSADLRKLASVVYQAYVALVAEGFTEAQALVIVGQMLRASGGGAS